MCERGECRVDGIGCAADGRVCWRQDIDRAEEGEDRRLRLGTTSAAGGSPAPTQPEGNRMTTDPMIYYRRDVDVSGRPVVVTMLRMPGETFDVELKVTR